MNLERAYDVLVCPHITEKSTRIADAHAGKQVVFKVAKSANKLEVKHAVEQLFNVKVEAVNILNVKGKKRRFGQREGRRNDWKKAYVVLKQGEDIDFTGTSKG